MNIFTKVVTVVALAAASMSSFALDQDSTFHELRQSRAMIERIIWLEANHAPRGHVLQEIHRWQEVTSHPLTSVQSDADFPGEIAALTARLVQLKNERNSYAEPIAIGTRHRIEVGMFIEELWVTQEMLDEVSTLPGRVQAEHNSVQAAIDANALTQISRLLNGMGHTGGVAGRLQSALDAYEVETHAAFTRPVLVHGIVSVNYQALEAFDAKYGDHTWVESRYWYQYNPVTGY